MMGRKMTLSLANMGVGVVLGLVATFLTARYFRSEGFGEVQFALSALGILFFITDLGMGQAHVKRVSEGRDPGDCFATFAVFKVVSTLVFVIASLVFLGVYLYGLGRTIEDTSIAILLFSLLYYVGKSMQEIGQSSFDARLEAARSQLAIFTDTAVRTGLTILAAYVVAATVYGAGPLLGLIDPDGAFAAWVRQDPGVLLAIATAAGGLAAAAVSWTMLRRGLERGRFRWDLLKDYGTFAFPLFLTSAIGLISFHVDSFVLGHFLGDVDVGVFGFSKRLPLVVAGIGVALSLLLFPAISSLSARGDTAGVSRSVDRATRWLSMLLAPILFFSAAFAAPLIHLVLSDQADALAMGILCAYVYVSTLAIPHSNLLLGTEKHRVVARLGALTAATVIILNLLLVPTDIKSLGLTLGGLGVIGAAVATLVSGIVWYTGLRIATWRLVGYRDRTRLWTHLLAATFMTVVLLGVHQWLMPLTRFFHVPLYGALGGLLYLGALLLLREFTREDWAYVRESVHPMEMLRYVWGELRHKRR